MAASLDNIQKLIDDINKTLKSSQGKITADAKDYVKQFKDVDAAAKSLELTLKGIRQSQLEMNTGLDDLKDRFKDIGKELNKQDFIYKSMYKSFNKLVNFAEDLSDIQYDLANSTLKETRGLQNKVNLEFNRLKNQSKYLQQQIEIKKLKNEDTSKEKELLEFAQDEVKAFEEKVGYQDQFNKAIDETYKRQKRVHNAIGLTGKLIGGLGSLLEKVGFDDFSEEIKNAKDQMGSLAIEITKNGEKSAGFIGTLRVGLVGLKSLSKSVAVALTDPLTVLTIMYKTIKFLIGAVSEFSKGVSNVGKSFGIAGKQAEETYKTIAKSQDLYHFPDELIEGQKKYNEAVGFNLVYNKENAALMQDLTHYLGLSDEQAGKLVRRSRILGQDFKSMDKDMAGVTNNFNKQNKTAVPYAKVAEQISKVSASTAFNIKGGAKGLAEAAVIAARYGREIDDINNSAKQLLNFEESISNEIEAELLTGKDLNLEKLRYAALTGDAITQAKEQERLVKENFKSLKGNVLAQEAFAKSIGMTTEDVAKMVEQQEIEADILKKEGITGLQRHQAEMKAQAKQAKQAEATDRAFKSAIMQLKTALLPLIQKITPFFITMAESMASIGKILSGGVGKTLLAIIGGAGALYAGGKIIKGIGSLFDGGLGMGKGEMVGGDKPGTAKTGFLEKVLGLGRGKIGESAKNPMYVYVVNQGEGGNGGDGGETSGDLLEDILGKGKKGGTIGKGLTGRLFSKGGRDVLKRVGGGSLLKGIGKSLLSPKRLLKVGGGVGSLLGGFALDYAEEAQMQKVQQLKEQAQVAKTEKEKEELLKRAQKTKRVGQLAGVGSAALTGASIGATIGAPFFGIGAGAGAAIGAGIGGGYQLLKNYFSDSDEAEDFILRPGQKPLKFRKDDVIIGGTNVEGTKTSNTNTNNDALLKEFQEMKQILNAILHKEGTIMLNGTKMGTAMAVGSYKTQ